MGESDPPKAPARRYGLDVRLRTKSPKPPPVPPWPPQRWRIIAAIASLFVVSLVAWFQLSGHPIGTWIAALPQVGFLFGGIVSVLGSGDRDGWHRELSAAVTQLVDRYTNEVCLAVLLLDIAVLWAGMSMQTYDVQCPSGFRLRYGTMSAEVRCDVHEERIWMPFGAARTLEDAWCVPPDGDGGWSPRFRYDAWHVGGPGEDPDHEEVTCYEDGSLVRTVAPRDSYLYLEWGWNALDQEVTLAPCAHLAPGVYDYDAQLHRCRRLGGPEYVTTRFEEAFDAGERTFEMPVTGECDAGDDHDGGCGLPPLRLAGEDAERELWEAVRVLAQSTCPNCRGAETHPYFDGGIDASQGSDAGVDAGPEAGIASATREDRVHVDLSPTSGAPQSIDVRIALDEEAPAHPSRCPRPGAGDPAHGRHFTFYYPDGCHERYGALALSTHGFHVPANVSVGVSFRGDPPRRCVPAPARRDGFLHLFLTDLELVFGITKRGERLVLVERVRRLSHPSTFAEHCGE